MSPKVHSTPSLHDAVFGTCWHPTAGSHVSSVHGFASSQPPAVQRGVVVVLIDMVVEEVLVVDEGVVSTTSWWSWSPGWSAAAGTAARWSSRGWSAWVVGAGGRRRRVVRRR